MSNYDFYQSIRFSSRFNSLKYKYETGINSSEYSLYQLLDDEVSILALNLKLDHILCGALARVHGFVFVDDGIDFWDNVENYLLENGHSYKICKIKSDIVRINTRSISNKPNDNFYELVEEMYSLKSKVKEVKLVNECYKIIKSLQPLKNTNIDMFYDIEEKAIKELKEKSLEINDVANIDMLKCVPSEIARINIERKDKALFNEALSREIEHYKNKYPDNSLYNNLVLAIDMLIIKSA